MKSYYVNYKLYSNDKIRGINIPARNKEDAYFKALKMIHEKENEEAYSLWVNSVTFNNGNYKMFNTFEGKPI